MKLTITEVWTECIFMFFVHLIYFKLQDNYKKNILWNNVTLNKLYNFINNCFITCILYYAIIYNFYSYTIYNYKYKFINI